MLSEQVYKKIIRISAWYDLIVTWPFATPISFAFIWGIVLANLNNFMGFEELPDLDVHAVLFANFFGSVVILWSVVRLVMNDPRLGVFDGIGRVLFSFWMLNAFISGATPLIWLFLIPEIIFGILQLFMAPRQYLRLKPK